VQISSANACEEWCSSAVVHSTKAPNTNHNNLLNLTAQQKTTSNLFGNTQY